MERKGLRGHNGFRPCQKRDEEIVRLRRIGWTYKRLGQTYGISATRARGICVWEEHERPFWWWFDRGKA